MIGYDKLEDQDIILTRKMVHAPNKVLKIFLTKQHNYNISIIYTTIQLQIQRIPELGRVAYPREEHVGDVETHDGGQVANHYQQEGGVGQHQHNPLSLLLILNRNRIGFEEMSSWTTST